MRKIRLAVIGAGAMGTRHAELICRHEACSLVGLVDADPERRMVAERLGVPFRASVDALLDQERPDGAIVATPNTQHVPVAESCLRRSVPVLVEKPVADTPAQAWRLVEAARSRRTPVLVGHHRRHNPLICQARRLVREGALGQLVGVSALWALCKPDEYFVEAWRRQRPGGGPLLINLIHELDSLRFLCGEVSQVHAYASAAVRGLEVEDSLCISLRFDSGALGTVLASDTTPAAWSYEANTGENPVYFHAAENCYHFLGTEGSLAFPRLELWRYPPGTPRGWQHGLEKRAVEVTPADPLRLQLDHFCRVVRGEDEPLVDALDGARTLALAAAVRESADTGQPADPAAHLADPSTASNRL